jgi:hypothetical protein
VIERVRGSGIVGDADVRRGGLLDVVDLGSIAMGVTCVRCGGSAAGLTNLAPLKVCKCCCISTLSMRALVPLFDSKIESRFIQPLEQDLVKY